MYFSFRQRIAVWAVSLSIAILLMVVVIVNGIYAPRSPYMVPMSQAVNNAMAMAIVVGLAFPAFVEYKNASWLRGVDENIPRLLRDLAESVGSGIPFVRALEEASGRDYGPVTVPLRTAVAKFRLTADLEGALEWLSERLVRPSARRLTTILVEAAETGGRIMEVLEASVGVFSELAGFQDEKEAHTRPYILMAYVGSVVFLLISWVILTKFLGPLAGSLTDPVVAGGGPFQNILEIEYYKSILFWAAAMEAIFGGLIGGKISQGKLSAGLVHSVVLLVITIVAFNLFSV
jgi:flagellar protein FlaJ